MNAIRLSEEAESELDAIWLYLAHESGSVDTASRVVDSITEHFWFLGEHPQVGRRRDDDLRLGLRSFPVQSYVILYRIDADGCSCRTLDHYGGDCIG